MTKRSLHGAVPPHSAPEGLTDVIMEQIYADKYERKFRRRIVSVAAAVVIVFFVAFAGYKHWYDAKHLVVMEFTYSDPNAADVRVTGDFSAWSTSGITLKKHDGVWSVKIKVPEGSYRYMFIVDGKTILDPSASRVKDPFGDDASVRITNKIREEI